MGKEERKRKDKTLSKDLLKKLINLNEGDSLDGLKVIETKLTYQGNRHADFSTIFENEGNFYRVKYYDHYGSLVLGKWMGKDQRDLRDKNEYVCEQVFPFKRKVTVKGFE
jgi:hypothetical protein